MHELHRQSKLIKVFFVASGSNDKLTEMQTTRSTRIFWAARATDAEVITELPSSKEMCHVWKVCRIKLPVEGFQPLWGENKLQDQMEKKQTAYHISEHPETTNVRRYLPHILNHTNILWVPPITL